MEDVNWNSLLPGHQWIPRNAKCWLDFVPAPSKQLTHLLPKNFEGSCQLHAYSETLTAILRKTVGSNNICVDLGKLLQICVDNGVLKATGTTGKRLMEFVNSDHAIPLLGYLPDHFVGDPLDKVENPVANISLMGSQLGLIKAKPFPFGTTTAEQAKDAIFYRELLCSILDNYPVVICFPLQNHYAERRDGTVPYRLLEGEHHYMKRDKQIWRRVARYFGLIDSKSERLYHCVTAYAYDCSGGDVRTLRIHYQENASGAPDDQPDRHTIHPDAIESCFVPFVDQAYFCNTPSDH